MFRSIRKAKQVFKHRWNPKTPKGPKIEKIQDFPLGLNVQARLKFSSEPPAKPLFLWGILKVKIEHFKRDWKFQARLKISSEIEIFQDSGPWGRGRLYETKRQFTTSCDSLRHFATSFDTLRHSLVCSMPSLKFVKEFLLFSVSRPGHWEDSNTKKHEEWPQKSPRVTDSD